MFDQLLSQMQNQTDGLSKELENVFVEAEAENGLVKVVANGNKVVKNIIISDEIADDKEAIEDLVLVAVNRAMEKAERLHTEKMQGIAQNMIPGLGDLGNLFGK